MRSQVVITHYRCNQRCSYCVARRAEDDLAWIQAAAVRARVDAALAEGAEELVFTGGEPTQRGDLPSLVAYARSRGAREVALETNGTLLDRARAVALRDAGLARAVVNLSGWGDALDQVTADEGGFARTLAGIDALLAAGVRVELRAAVVRSTAPGLVELPARVRARWPEGVALLWLTAPDRSPDETELIDPREAAAVVAAVDATARRVGLAVALAPDTSLTPCLFPSASRAAHLFSLSRGGRPRDDRVHLAVCEGCGVRAACPGFSREALARFGEPVGAAPVTEERTRRRLTLAGPVAQQVEREFVQRNLAVIPGTGRVVTEALVRVYFHCNQACSFCYVSTHLPPAGDARVREAIVAEARAGHLVTLTGGEPTLHPRLVEFVRAAREHDVAGLGVALQTNAVRLDDASLTDALVAEGVTLVQVSLHAAHAALSDAITQAPGTFARTLKGLDHLARHAAVTLVINYVIVRRNVGDLGGFVELVAARWPRALVNVSFAALSTDVVPDDGDVMPRYTDVMPALEAALDRARALGLAVTGFASMCGVPLCLVSERHRPGEGDLGAIPEGWDAGEFVRGEACGGCGLRGRCYGLRRRYAERYGDGELRALP
jgi:MoaA/NifB/PqqE/SkfB family radical SAM enzyme